MVNFRDCELKILKLIDCELKIFKNKIKNMYHFADQKEGKETVFTITGLKLLHIKMPNVEQRGGYLFLVGDLFRV